MHNDETMSAAIKAALEASETLQASNVTIENVRQKYDIENDRKQVRVWLELTFDVR